MKLSRVLAILAGLFFLVAACNATPDASADPTDNAQPTHSNTAPATAPVARDVPPLPSELSNEVNTGTIPDPDSPDVPAISTKARVVGVIAFFVLFGGFVLAVNNGRQKDPTRVSPRARRFLP